MKRRELVVVRWRDTETEGIGWQEPAATSRPLRYRTVGYVIRRSKRFLVVSPTIVSDGRVNTTWRIPIGAIVEIRSLVKRKIRRRRRRGL